MGKEREFIQKILPLVSLLVLGSFLVFWNLAKDGWANEYYAAGVQGMMTSPQAWFFASFDGGLFVSIDKPPLGFWIQALSAWIFGFSAWSLALPQALAYLGAVCLLFRLVGDRLGPVPGFFSGAVFALTPIAAAAARNNTPDMILVCLLVLSAKLALDGLDRNQAGKVVLAAGVIGLGFLVKMLQAFLVIPGILLLLWLSAWPWRKKVFTTLAGAAVFLALGASWIAAVELTPAESRPWVGSSKTNSALELVFGHNGITRLTGSALPSSQAAPQDSSRPNPITEETGSPGPLRLLAGPLADQAGWFLFPALAAGLTGLFRAARSRAPGGPERPLILLGLTWTLPLLLYFSLTTGLFHRYYLVFLAPGLAILSALLWYVPPEPAAGRGKNTLLSSVVLALSMPVTAAILLQRVFWPPALIVLAAVLLAALAGVFSLLLGRGKAAGVFLTAALLVPPAVWSMTPLVFAENGPLPQAGPALAGKPRGEPVGPLEEAADYLEADGEGARWLAAVRSAIPLGSRVSLLTGRPVLSLGGFGGSDRILEPEALTVLLDSGAVRFYLEEVQQGPMTQAGNEDLTGLIKARSEPVTLPGLERLPLKIWKINPLSQGEKYEN